MRITYKHPDSEHALVVDAETGAPIPFVVAVDPEVGEVWRYVPARDGHVYDNGPMLVEWRPVRVLDKRTGKPFAIEGAH